MINSLNPYCSGQWSRTSDGITAKQTSSEVLILIVVDNGLVPVEQFKAQMNVSRVLILIVVDNGLVLDLIRLF